MIDCRKDPLNHTVEKTEKERYSVSCANGLFGDVDHLNVSSDDIYCAKHLSNNITENTEKESDNTSLSNALYRGLNHSNALPAETDCTKDVPNYTSENAEKERYDASGSNAFPTDLDYLNTLSDVTDCRNDLPNQSVFDSEHEHDDLDDIVDFDGYKFEFPDTLTYWNSYSTDLSMDTSLERRLNETPRKKETYVEENENSNNELHTTYAYASRPSYR